MMKKYAILLVLALAACNPNFKPSGSQPFFIFDQVDYFHTDISQPEVKELYQKPDKSRKDLAMLQIIGGNVPVNTLDTVFIHNMDVLGFTKKTLDKSLNSKLSKIFSVKHPENIVAAACEPTYRDILIFRQKRKVIGIAKLCFDCSESQITGARYDAREFGMSGEFDQLRTLLEKR